MRNDRFRLSVYADHRSYIGNYRSLGTDGLLPEAAIVPDGTHYSGHDLLSRAGVDGTFDWETGVLSFRAGYYGTAFKDTVLTRAYDGLDLNFDVDFNATLIPASNWNALWEVHSVRDISSWLISVWTTLHTGEMFSVRPQAMFP